MDERIHQLATVLVRRGLTRAFGVTGSGSSLSLVLALESLGVRYYPVSHEASGAIMAGAVAATSGTLSASLSIKGPGLANMLPGIVHNHLENNPVLSISEAFGPEVPSARKHKRLNHSGFVAAVVKTVGNLNDIEHRLPRLLATARAEVPGPVHLDLCSSPAESGDRPTPNSKRLSPTESQSWRAALRMLRGARRPALIIGSLAGRREWAGALGMLRVPVFTTVAAKGTLNERLPHSGGIFTGDGKELSPEARLLPQADVVLGLGLRNTEVLLARPLGARTVIVDEVPGLADGFGAKYFILENLKSIAPWIEAVKERCWGVEENQRVRRDLRDHLAGGGWLPAACFDILNRGQESCTLVADTGSFCTIGEHVWSANSQRRYLASNNGRFMGVGIPLAIGAALASNGQPVFCAVGDGGVRPYFAELRLAVEDRLPVCVLLMSDGCYGSIVCASPAVTAGVRAVNVVGRSWYRCVEAMGCDSCQVVSATALERVLGQWNRETPLFIECRFDAGRYAEMTRGLR